MWIYLLLAVIVIAADQATKWVIVNKLSLHETHSVIGEFFSITSHRNKGAAFGILQNQRWFFLVITVVVIIGIVWYMRKVYSGRKHFLLFGLSLLLGGAVGNMIDRARHGEVVDFFQFYFQSFDYTFPIFNVADSCIVVGVAIIFIDSIIGWNKERSAPQVASAYGTGGEASSLAGGAHESSSGGEARENESGKELKHE